MAAHEVGGLGDLERLPQLLVGGVGLAEAQVAGHRAGEQVRLLGHQADAAPQQPRGRGRGRRRRRRAPRPTVASKRRGTRLSSVVLPEPVLPMMAVVCPARRRERDVA